MSDDSISRKATLDVIGNVPDYDDGMVFEALSHAQRDVALLPSAQQWIPCSERLPAEGESVLLCDRGGYMTLGRLVRTDEGYKWDAGTWWTDIEDGDAWMPLPEPYKEKDNG